MRKYLWLLAAFILLVGFSLGLGFYLGVTSSKTTAQPDAGLTSSVSKDAIEPPETVEHSFARSSSLFLAQKEATGSKPRSMTDRNMPYQEYIRLLSQTRKLGQPTGEQQPASVENFSFLTLDHSVTKVIPEPSEKLKALAREALAQKFMVEAKPFLVASDITKEKIDVGMIKVVLPVVATTEPKHPLILQEASLGKVLVGKKVVCARLEEVMKERAAILDLAKNLGLRVRGDGWARVETENWIETPFHLLKCRILIPVE